MSSIRLVGVSLGAITAVLLAAGPAEAQQQPVLEEVIVTAQKRVQNLQDTPISIATFGEAELERRAITNVGDLANNVPNLRIAPFGVSPTTLRIYIRGLGVVDSQPTQDSPVGIYLNGIYVARPVGLTLDVANIERVEVLRGPQGTLYGRNTTGGAVNVITKKPDDKLAMSQMLGFGNFGAFRSQTSLNLPVTDKFFVAGAFSTSQRDGWLKNDGPGHDFSELDSKSGRVDVRFLPLDGLTIDYGYDRADSRYTPDYYHLTEPAGAGALLPGLPAEPNRLKRVTLPDELSGSRDKAFGHTLVVSGDTGLGEVKSTTGYRKVSGRSYNIYPNAIYENDPFTLRQKQFSQELQLVGSTGSKTFDYIAGLYYFRERGRETATDRFLGFPIPRDIEAINRSQAAYGQVTWRPEAASPFSVTVGGRYTRDKRTGDNHLGIRATRKDNNFSGAVTVDYRVTETALVYAKAVQGYKAGGFNMRQADFGRSFAPEKLISYEVGFKTELLDRRLRFNGAAFYMDYKDMQLDILVPNQPDPTLTRTINAGKARILGVETEATVLVTDALRLSATYGHLNDKVKRVTGDDARLWRLPNAPAHTITGTLDWDVLSTDFGALNFTADTSWRSRSYTGARQRPGDDVMAYAVTDLRLSFTGDDWVFNGSKVSVSGWVRNAFDREYYRDTFGSFVGTFATKVSTYGTPRTYGIDLKISY